jgi:PAP2 superfamily
MIATKTLVLSAALCMGMNASQADVITDWNEKTVAWVTNPAILPPAAERIVTMTQVAMFDAVNSIEHRYHPYLVQIASEKPASAEAAAAAAAATILVGIDPKAPADLTAYLAAMPEGEAKTEGIRLGQAVAAKVLAARASDGANAPDAYRPRTQPGVYIPTPITASSMWPNVTPFAMNSPAQFRPHPPVPLDSKEWIADCNEVATFGSKTSTSRSPRQTEDARFWLMAGPISLYPLARQLVSVRHMTLIDSARFMALLSIAESDGYIAVFDAKYTYAFWRPITAIRNLDMQDNPAMKRDATWQPIDNTPMHPEYPCAHCVDSAIFASVVETLFGSAEIPNLTMTSTTAPGVTHRWTNLWAYANEVSEARIWAGFHYRSSTQVGQDMGRRIGQYAVQTVMQPDGNQQ